MNALCRPAEYLSRETTHCPTCKTDRDFAGRTALWYGVTVSCTTCGDSWTDGELHERPFRRAWRVQAAADAKRLWEAAEDSSEEGRAEWLRAQVEAHRPVEEVAA